MYLEQLGIGELTVNTLIGGNKINAAGKEYYVDPTNGSNGNSGNSATDAKATLIEGEKLLAADQNDILYLIAGTSGATLAAAMTWDKSNTSLIGISPDGSKLSANNMPFITVSADVNLDIDAANVTVANIKFVNSFTNLTSLIDVSAANFSLVNCHFYGDAADADVDITVITDAGANDMTIEGCTFNYLVATDGTTALTETSTEAIRLVGADRAVIKDCYISGDFTVSAISGVTTASKDIKIIGNVINNIATENIEGGIDLDTADTGTLATTGWIGDNYVYVAYSVANTGFINSRGCVLGRNWVSNVAGEVPVLHGTLEAGDVEAQIIVIDGIVDTIASDLLLAQSDLVVALSDIKAIGSDLIVTNAIIDTIASDLLLAQSDLVVALSDIKVIGSDLIVTNAIIDTIASDISVIMERNKTGVIAHDANTGSASDNTIIDISDIGVLKGVCQTLTGSECYGQVVIRIDNATLTTLAHFTETVTGDSSDITSTNSLALDFPFQTMLKVTHQKSAAAGDVYTTIAYTID